MTPASPAATFRDPAGSLHFEPQHAVRTIHPSARSTVLDFLASPFCRDAQQRGDLISAQIETQPETQIENQSDAPPDSHPASQPEPSLVLRHPRIPVPTYPWEWTPSQWLAAAELTLTLAREALAHGWLLKDATPLNILFDGPRPIFVDILSFEPLRPGNPIWLAYGQYVRTFLLPLLAARILHWPLALTLFKRDGYEPAEIFCALSFIQRLAPAALWPVTLPALMERRQPEAVTPPKPPRKLPPDAASAVLDRTFSTLLARTRKALPASARSHWSDYPATASHYTPQQSQDKAAWVRSTLTSLQPASVLDIGANTGEFSALAASLGASVVALERDAPAADRLHRMASARGPESARPLPILTIHADLARPTPAAGWENTESSALLPRLEGRFDCVLLLAVLHHLILMEQIPIPAILALLHRLTTRDLILEWVPPSDPMYQALMRGRDTLYGGLSESDLLTACDGLFALRDRHPLGNARVLFHLEKLV